MRCAFAGVQVLFYKKLYRTKARFDPVQHFLKRIYFQSCALIFLPRLDVELLHAEGAEGVDEGGGEAGVGDERDVEVDGGAAYLVAVGQLAGGSSIACNRATSRQSRDW